MADFPILFPTPMIQALLAGDKTMTRRLAWREAKIPAHLHDDPSDPTVPTSTVWQKVEPGDRLYVKESFKETASGEVKAGYGEVRYGTAYRADGHVEWAAHNTIIHDLTGQPDTGPMQFQERPWKPSIHMFRYMSRITLIVTEKRLERVRDINNGDARAEGVDYWPEHAEGRRDSFPALRFRDLWGSLYGSNAWDENPEIVAMCFTVHIANIDAMDEREAACG